jgi:DnaA-homolog protein
VPDQLLLGVRLRDSSVFASYFAGRNRAIVDVLKALQPGTSPTCLFIQGAAASGKSHLLQAVSVDATERGLSAAYLPLREIRSIGPEMLTGWGELDIVCIDDVEEIAHARDWNLALFALHQQLEERRSRLVVTSRLAPAALHMTLPDLGSRLAGGLMLTLQGLEDSEQVSALQLRAQLRGFELPDETARLLLTRLPRDMTSLCGFLDRLDEASLVQQRRLTPRFVREVMDRK